MANKWETHQPDEALQAQRTRSDNLTWLEVTTQNVLPGQVLTICLEDADDPKADPAILNMTVDDDGKAIVLFNSKIPEEPSEALETEPQEATYFSSPPEEPKAGQFIQGWWALDEAGECPITRAVPGMRVFFHLETTIPDGEQVHLELHDDDNNEPEASGTGDKDDHIPREDTITHIRATHETACDGKIVVPIVLDNLEGYLSEDPDQQLELYFRCSCNGENVELPHNPDNYLMVGTLVIDRYKMPGLNGRGTAIADDMAYGTGLQQEEGIYTTAQINQYKIDYESNGFDEEKHALFSNRECVPSKAIYTKEQCYNFEYSKMIYIPFTFTYLLDFVTKDTGKDLRDFNEGKSPITGKWRDDDYLFWDFEETAELYFARGELQTNLNQMIAKFRSNTGGIYEDPILTRNIENHPATLQYCEYIENYIAEKISQATLANLAQVEDKEPDLGDKNELEDKRRNKDKIKGDDIVDNKGGSVPITSPMYSYGSLWGLWEASKGLTIATNDLWATEVTLITLKNNGADYTARYQVILWDHFGLDKPDMEKIFNVIPSVKEAFACWFVLQHLRGYRPFLTKVMVEKEFTGNIHEGREARRTRQRNTK